MNIDTKAILVLATLSALSPIALLFRDQSPVYPISIGTHAPASSHNVWRLALKEGGFGSAFPVALKGDKQALFLTAKHMMIDFTEGIVEDRTKVRKLMIVSYVEHEKADLALLTVLVDDKKLDLIPLGLDLKRDPGLCVFNVGFVGPRHWWIAHQGWLMRDAFGHGMSSAWAKGGMSGGAVLTPNAGKVIGVLVGFAKERRFAEMESVYKEDGEVVGKFYPILRNFEQSFFVPLALHKEWLRKHHVIE